MESFRKSRQCWGRIRVNIFLQKRMLSRTHGEEASFHKTVDLASSEIISLNGNATDKPLVILHGLFGSKRNWGSICKTLHREMPGRSIYALDLRNHGSSPHALPMTYEAMAADVHKFIEDKRLTRVALLGHSMGGKVAMTYALSQKAWKVPPGTLSKLIVADIAPSKGILSSDFVRYISSMQKIESLPAGAIRTRKDADLRLSVCEHDRIVRQFLLTNLRLPPQSQSAHFVDPQAKAKFIVPLSIIAHSIPDLGSFPYELNPDDNTAPTTWKAPTLVIKGTNSNYINYHNELVFRAFFPNMHIKNIDAGHWVHAEKPQEFRKLVVDFLGTD